MLEKVTVISNLRRLIVRVSSNHNLSARSPGATANPEPIVTPKTPSPLSSSAHNIQLDIPDKVIYHGKCKETCETDKNMVNSSELDDSSNINNVLSSANLLTFEEKKAVGFRERMKSVGKRSVTASDSLPLPAAHHRIQSCVASWFTGLIRIPILLMLLYFFVCSLDFLSTAFRLIAGKTAGTIFQNNPLLSNPIVGLMIAILFTVLVQSSSTCTSVIVSLVSSDILDVRMAIPMVMGANIGTSLTSTLVSLTQVTNKLQFERAFAGATVHDCFNWLSVITLLILEVTTGYLYHVTGWLTQNAWSSSEESGVSSNVASATNVNILGAITKPFTKTIVQIDKDVLQCWSLGECHDQRLLKIWCNKTSSIQNVSSSFETDKYQGQLCGFLLNIPSFDDLTVGIILLFISLFILSVCLVLIVKVLSALLQGTVADMIKKTINADIPYVPWLTGYLAIIMGAILTFIIQSSSVFTSTLTPLVGVGLITVERVYPLTLGSNLGTTTTALIASLAAEGSDRLRNSLQIALCHFFFNFTGILLFYPIPFMRWPVVMCKTLGRLTAEYRWFAVAYLIFMFFLLPGIVLGLSMAGPVVLFSVTGPIVFLLTLVIAINLVQRYLPTCLPPALRDWSFLPLWMRSLDPMDGVIRRMTCGFFCCSQYDMVQDGGLDPEFDGDEEHQAITINV